MPKSAQIDENALKNVFKRLILSRFYHYDDFFVSNAIVRVYGTTFPYILPINLASIGR